MTTVPLVSEDVGAPRVVGLREVGWEAEAPHDFAPEGLAPRDFVPQAFVSGERAGAGLGRGVGQGLGRLVPKGARRWFGLVVVVPTLVSAL